MKTLFEKSVPGRKGVDTGMTKGDLSGLIDKKFIRKSDNSLPELSEPDVIRHYTRLSQINFSVDTHFYPLGSCTMKYSPRINEKVSSLDGFTDIHPFLAYINENEVQGALEIIFNLSEILSEITGMKQFTTQPYAGAHGELAGILLMAAYHKSRGKERKYIVVPESAHGTNPASAVMGGYSVISIPVDDEGCMDVKLYREKMNRNVAGIMLTLPNTLGLFHRGIEEIIQIAHENDSIVYNDGANLNAIMGKLRPGDTGFDIMHINLHKTFSTPHGGGGPGAGVVGVSEKLTDFLMTPIIKKNKKGAFFLDFSIRNSIGPMASFFGNFGVLVKAYTYILMLGKEGLIDVSEKAVLNANYILSRLKNHYHLPYDRACMHECVFSARNQAAKGVHAIDISKALIDRGIHPPTVYFPQVVEEALMIEPTETESRETLDLFIDAMIDIAELAKTRPEMVINTPVNAPISRPDETRAARELRLTCGI